MHGNPDYDFSHFDWTKEVAFARGKEGATYDAINGNYSAFADKGGKFLMYHGWADSLIPKQPGYRAHRFESDSRPIIRFVLRNPEPCSSLYISSMTIKSVSR